MVTAEQLEKNIGKVLAPNPKKVELFRFLDRNEDKIKLIKKTALAREIGVSRPTLDTWLNEYHNQK